jgi:[ribosomal protein S5]-alanine N-acetyltransferase
VLPLPQTLNTSRLRLRGPVASDASAIFQSYTQDPEVCRFMIWRPHPSESATEEFIASCVEEWKTGSRLPYIITELHSNVAIGMLEARMQGTTVDIGYVLARSYWGNGFMPEAIQAFTGLALQSWSVFRVQATCDTENIPSQRALEKSGFTREGCLERYTVHPNISSEPRACFMYAKCRKGENAH